MGLTAAARPGPLPTRPTLGRTVTRLTARLAEQDQRRGSQQKGGVAARGPAGWATVTRH